MPRLRSFLFLLAAAFVVATSPAPAQWVDAIEAAHDKAAYTSHGALAGDLTLEFGGNTLADGSLLMDTPGGKVRLTLDDGTVLVFDGATAWQAPADSQFQGGRFHVLTWSYFLAAPMKLSDDGTHVEPLGELPFLDGESLEAARLSFGDGVGDSPDDWYVLYRDSDTHRLAGMAYIATFGKSLEKAEDAPHAIVYGGWRQVDGVWLSTDWTFYNWSRAEGVSGEPIGHVTLENLRFVDYDADDFQAPEGAQELPAPPAG